MQTVIAGLAVLAFAALASADARAQTKPAPGKCYPNFIATCYAQCAKVGGQVRGCQAYCEKEKRTRNCP